MTRKSFRTPSPEGLLLWFYFMDLLYLYTSRLLSFQRWVCIILNGNVTILNHNNSAYWCSLLMNVSKDNIGPNSFPFHFRCHPSSSQNINIFCLGILHTRSKCSSPALEAGLGGNHARETHDTFFSVICDCPETVTN